MKNQPAAQRVRDPSEGHLLPLCPNQGFTVELTGGKREIACDSHLLKHTTSEYGSKQAVFGFEQKFDLTPWSQISRVFLGEILTINKVPSTASNTTESFGSICVYLKPSTPHCRTTTVINPSIASIKVDVLSRLEVVLFETGWKVDIFTGIEGLQYSQVEHLNFDPKLYHSFWQSMNKQKYFMYPRAPMWYSKENLPSREHHYWFKLTDKSLLTASGLPNDTYSAGKIIFEKDKEIKILNISLNVKAKDRRRLFHDVEPEIKIDFDQPPEHRFATIQKPKNKWESQSIGSGHSVGYHSHTGGHSSYIHVPSLQRHEVCLVRKDDTNIDSEKVLILPDDEKLLGKNEKKVEFEYYSVD